MLDLDTRTAILKLHAEGHSGHFIARTLGTTRRTVRRVIRSGQREVPDVQRPDQCLPHIERIRELQQVFHGDYIMILQNGQRLALSRSYRDKLHELLGRTL